MTHTASQPIYTRDMARNLPRFDRSVSWLCWAYNEEELIEGYLLRAQNLLEQTVEDYEIVVIDDCSTDRTNAIVTRLQQANPRIRLIRNEQNLNVGLSSQKAIYSAGKEYLFWQTIDWSYDISLLRLHLELLKTHDIVAGVRRAPVRVADEIRFLKPLLALFKLFGVNHVTRCSDTVGKAIVSLINYILIRLLFRVPLSDYQNVVFYPTRLIQSITYEAKSSFANPEGLIKCHWKGASIAEVPISFIPRTAGEAKGTRFKAIQTSVWDIFRLWWRWIVLGRRGPATKGVIRRLRPEEWGLPGEAAAGGTAGAGTRRAWINDMAQRALTWNKADQKASLGAFLRGLDLPDDCRVLDFGCGTGLFAPLFAELGMRYTGYDIDTALVAYANRRHPEAVFCADREALGEQGPYDLILINCCAHHIPDADLLAELSFLKGLLCLRGICLLVDILHVPPDQDTFLHRQFMKLEQGRHVRTAQAYHDLISTHFTITHQTRWRSHLFSLPWKCNPLYNDLIVLAGRAQ